MFLSLNWLKDFVEIPKNVTPEKLGESLNLHTVEVEKIEYQADKYKNVVVGKILEVRPHPNADRLKLALVDIGKEKLEIVCGANNIEPGQFVPVALVGAILPGMSAKGGSASGGEIKPAEIRGVKSNGMLCAEDELGLGDDHKGIMILEKRETPLIPPFRRGAVKVGQPLSDYLKLDDVIFEVDNKSLTHRADLLSHYGMARDISAILNTKFKPIKIPLTPFIKGGLSGGRLKIKVKVEDFKLCPRYMAIAMAGIKIEASPEWLKARLAAAGMRPINNIVDVTNYVMLELGQPLHAFDFSKISGEITNPKSQFPINSKNAATIIVRCAKAGEIMETLDGQKRKLDKDMLVIADKQNPVAIAGVMGGASSEINGQTDSIIIEAANFNFDSIRKTAGKLGLRTESSARFEKGLDPNLAELGLGRAVELIKQICPGAYADGDLVDEKETPLIPLLKGDGKGLKPINFDLNWLNGRVGQEFSLKQVKQILEKLGFGVTEKHEKFSVTIPTWRAVRDVSQAEDIVEEVARVYGYNNIKPVVPKTDMAAPLVILERQLEKTIKNILSFGARLAEVYNYSFLSSELLNKLKIDTAQAIKLANPLSDDLGWLRPSLTPLLLENIKTNQAKEDFISIYEIGSVFLNQPGEINKDNGGKENLLFQEKRLGLVLAATEEAGLFGKLKGIIEYLFKELNLEVIFEPEKNPLAWHQDSAATSISAGGVELGLAAMLDKNIARSLGVKKSAALAEISLPKLFLAVSQAPAKRFIEPAKYPEVLRDLAFVVNEKILYNNIVKEIKNFSDLIRQAELFDVYQGEALGAGKKSLAFHIIYQADKTLTSEEVDETQKKLIKRLEDKFEAKVRDF